MVCKMLFFDYKDSDKLFFDKNDLPNYDIKFFKNSLNKKAINNLLSTDLENTAGLSISPQSVISAEVINAFPNLRVIAIRSKEYKHIDLKSCVERNIAVVNVETTDKNNEFHILQTSFKSVTDVLCGCKENRIV